MATDFKLKVGLDVSQSSEQILRDLITLQNQLPSLDIKVGLGKKAIDDLKIQFATLDLPKIPVGVEVDPESLKAVTNKIAKELKLDFTPKESKKSGSRSPGSTTKETQNVAKEAQKLHKEFQKVGSTATNAINGMTESLRKLSAEESDAAGQLVKLAKQFQDVSHLLNKDVWDENETKQVQDFLKTFKEVTAEVKKQKRESGAAFFDEAQISKVYASLNKVRELVSQYPKILSDPRFKTWYESFNKINFDDLKTGKIDIEKLTREMSNFVSEAKQAGLATQTLGQRFQTIAKNAALGHIAQTLLSEIKQLGREAYENVKELDTAMVELKKVTDETSTTYSKFFENAKTQAKEVGSSLSDAITATADFARLGYSIGEAADLAKASQIYYNVGDGFNSITEASESVISTMKAFGIETQDVMRIVDAFNTTGNNFAISTQGVGEAMKRSASALAAAGNDMYESIALITAANSVVQDPESVGTALKTKFCLDVQKCAS